MKKLAILIILFTIVTSAGAQTLDTVFITNKTKKFQSDEHMLLSFEIIDTVDVTGKKIIMSRSYYFGSSSRSISSVREYYNPNNPEKGIQVIYSFGANKLASVTVIPAKSTCRDCATRYYYLNDTLISKQGNITHANSENFVKQAKKFRSRLPGDLPWGFFNNEVFVDGERKKIKNPY